jgi:hypothetical protein
MASHLALLLWEDQDIDYVRNDLPRIMNPVQDWGFVDSYTVGGSCDGMMTNTEVQNDAERWNIYLNTTRMADVPERIKSRINHIFLWRRDQATLHFIGRDAHRGMAEPSAQRLLATLIEIYT